MIESGRVKVSLIIAAYKQVEFLDLVLMSVERQTFRDFEVIVAEDDQSETIKELIQLRKGSFGFHLKHVSQEDKGFRKNRILNAAVKIAEGDYLVFIDGDCLLHRHFLGEHVKRLSQDRCLFGRRAMLDQKTTETIIKTKAFGNLSFFSLLLSRSRHVEDALYCPVLKSFRKTGLKGSNFSVSRENMLKINGFDEDFEKPYGGEDTDIERRLRLIDIKIVCSKYKTIQYHLYHGGRSGRDEEWLTEGHAFYQRKVSEGRWYCSNGILKENNCPPSCKKKG